jgi:hypothetical protein
MSVNFNNSEDFVKEFKIFNDGNAGIVDNVKMRVEKKAASDNDDKKPVYKLIATDDKSEINEGFYYCEPDSNAFDKYQAQRLILLAKGVLGKDIVFPVFSTPVEALDGVMKMIAPELNKRPYRVAVCYGTTKRKGSYLGFKSFGSFIQPMSEPNTLSFDKSDNMVRKPVEEATDATKLVVGMTTSGNPDNLDWMNK